MDVTSTEQMLSRWRLAREPEALGELLKTQRDRAYFIALRITKSPADAEDVVQEAFIKLLAERQGFEHWAMFEVTVYRAVLRCALNTVRNRTRRMARENTGGSLWSAARTDTMDSTSADSEEVRILLERAVEDLPDTERLPVLFCYYQGLNLSRTAAALQLPRSTVRARLMGALKNLRQRLRQNGRDVADVSLLALLWQSGNVSAPSSLCEKLDRTLAGRPCTQLPAFRSQETPFANAPKPERESTCLAVATISLIAAAMTVLCLAVVQPNMKAAVGKTAGAAEAIVASSSDSATKNLSVSDRKQEETMIRKSGITRLSAAAVLGTSLFAGLVRAGDGDPEVAKVLAEIETRREQQVAKNRAKDQKLAEALPEQAEHVENSFGCSNCGCPEHHLFLRDSARLSSSASQEDDWFSLATKSDFGEVQTETSAATQDED
jgi:RNA polymerase sigma-70 factor (ECF subfamily)